jgi:hypothetical protein
MPLNRDRAVEVAAALVVAALAGAGFLAVPQLVAGWAFAIPGTTDGPMAPTFFPRVAFATTAVFALLVVATAATRSDRLPLLAMKASNWLRLATLLAMMLAYLGGLRLFGFVPSSIVLMLVLPLLVGYRRPLPVLVTALAVPPVIALIFWHGLKVALPGIQALNLTGWFK